MAVTNLPLPLFFFFGCTDLLVLDFRREPNYGLTLFLYDGQGQECAQSHHGEYAKENANAHEEPQTFQPGSPIVLHIHHMCD